MHECIRLSAEAGFLIPQSATRADLGPLHARLGQDSRGRELAEEGLEIAKAQTPLAVPMVNVSKAEIALLEGSIDEAEALVGDADVSRLPGPIRAAAGAGFDLLRGQLAGSRGDHARVFEIADVLAWLERLHLRQFLPAALLLKGRVYVATGRPEEAEQGARGSAQARRGHGLTAACSGRSTRS
jgi:hypothetical protein